MMKYTINAIAAGAVALVAVGLAAPAVASASEVATAAGYSLSAPGRDYGDDFGVLGDRGPRTGVAGPGFGSGTARR